MRAHFLFLAMWLALAGVADAQSLNQPVPVRDDGLVATWFPPANGQPAPAIVVLGGSEGGEDTSKAIARELNAAGFGTLALAYFRAEGLPPAMQEIPLEYFDRAIAWLERDKLVEKGAIGIHGVSLGAETALLVASRNPAIHAVVAAVPTSMVWQGFDPQDYRSVKSSYSLAGKPVPYLPFDQAAAFTSVHDLYLRSLANAAAHPDAAIPAERIAGPILLLSARDDKLWPSTAMAQAVMVRLDAAGFEQRVEHIAYPDAGHGALMPPAISTDDSPRANIGGTPVGNRAAKADSWARVVAFFRTALAGDAR